MTIDGVEVGRIVIEPSSGAAARTPTARRRHRRRRRRRRRMPPPPPPPPPHAAAAAAAARAERSRPLLPAAGWHERAEDRGDFRRSAGRAGRGEYSRVPLHYQGTPFHRVIPGFMIQGDIVEGLGGECIWGGHFDDESLDGLHDEPGIVSMANAGRNSNSSQSSSRRSRRRTSTRRTRSSTASPRHGPCARSRACPPTSATCPGSACISGCGADCEDPFVPGGRT